MFKNDLTSTWPVPASARISAPSKDKPARCVRYSAFHEKHRAPGQANAECAARRSRVSWEVLQLYMRAKPLQQWVSRGFCGPEHPTGVWNIQFRYIKFNRIAFLCTQSAASKLVRQTSIVDYGLRLSKMRQVRSLLLMNLRCSGTNRAGLSKLTLLRTAAAARHL